MWSRNLSPYKFSRPADDEDSAGFADTMNIPRLMAWLCVFFVVGFLMWGVK